MSTPLTSTIPISSVAGPATGDGVIQSVARLLEAQTQVVAKAMVAHSFQPLTKFNGENDEEPFERWLETFDDRAKVVGWTTEQKLYQLKSHLHGIQPYNHFACSIVQTSQSTQGRLPP